MDGDGDRSRRRHNFAFDENGRSAERDRCIRHDGGLSGQYDPCTSALNRPAVPARPDRGERALRRQGPAGPRRPLHVLARRPRVRREQAASSTTARPATEADANAAVSAAALEPLLVPGQPNGPTGSTRTRGSTGATKGKPIHLHLGLPRRWATPVIPPTTAAGARERDERRRRPARHAPRRLTDTGGGRVGGRSDAPSPSRARTQRPARPPPTERPGRAGYGGAEPGTTRSQAMLTANDSRRLRRGRVTATATKHWRRPCPPPVADAAGAPVPVLGKSVVAGWCRAARCGSRLRNGKFRTLGANEAIPLGSTVDATKGKVRLTSAAGPGGATQTADFYKGAFMVTQTRAPSRSRSWRCRPS